MSRILLIDDEPGLCLLVSAELKDEGQAVTCAHTLTEADKLLAENTYDLLILDIRLGRDSGLTLLDRVRHEFGQRLPVILFSAFSAYRHDKTAWKADAYVEKSSDLSQLKMVVDRLLCRHQTPEDIS